ncbi:MAG TPA: agmatinase [Syntrophomonadaceae bacterium]|nr:agmatinase [Syntrophomonadaceae bacterium]
MKRHISNYLKMKIPFMGSSDNIEACEKVIIGIPMDTTVSFRPGTRLGPFRVREVSEGIEEYSIYQDKSLEDIDFYDAGDVEIPWGNVVTTLERTEDICNQLLEMNKKVFSIGGEHLISLPLIKAYKKKYPDLVVIQIDAHADLREDYLGERLSHATVMRHVVDIVGTKRVYQLGIRSGTKEEMEFARDHTFMYLNKLQSAVADVIEKVGTAAVYLTLDIDVLDPAFAPGTGTPEPGGFTSRELIQVILELGELNIVGFDMVEISPPNEKGDLTSILGAKILREALLMY